MRVNDPSVENMRLNYLRITNSTYLIAIQCVWSQCFNFGLTAKSLRNSVLIILFSPLENKVYVNWTSRCSTDHAVLRVLRYIENVLAESRLFCWCLLIRLITSEAW